MIGQGAIMKKRLPDIAYHLFSPLSEKYRGIEVNGEVIHWIEDTDKFYELFGYTSDMRKSAVPPEEFVKAEYADNPHFDFTACMQIQIIEYLRMHSHKFLQKYGNQCEEWLAALAGMRSSNPETCTTCKMQPVCSN
jgi:hypothetical protein